MELPIYDDVVKRVEEQATIEKQPTLDQYPVFEWIPGIPIMDDMTESEYKDLDEENTEVELV